MSAIIICVLVTIWIVSILVIVGIVRGGAIREQRHEALRKQRTPEQ